LNRIEGTLGDAQPPKAGRRLEVKREPWKIPHIETKIFVFWHAAHFCTIETSDFSFSMTMV
jgi:hypothetical protein